MQLHYILEFTRDIQYIIGENNIVENTLSIIEEITLINYDQIAKQEEYDDEFATLQKSASFSFKQHSFPSNNISIKLLYENISSISQIITSWN